MLSPPESVVFEPLHGAVRLKKEPVLGMQCKQWLRGYIKEFIGSIHFLPAWPIRLGETKKQTKRKCEIKPQCLPPLRF